MPSSPPLTRRKLHMRLRSDGSCSEDSDREAEQEQADGASNRMYPNLPKSKLTSSSGLYPPLTPPNPGEESPDSQRRPRAAAGDSRGVEADPRESQVRPERSDARSQKGDHNILFCLVCLAPLLLLLYTFYGSSHAKLVSPPPRDALEDFKTRIDALPSRFPGQSERVWRTIRAAARWVLTEADPEDPMILLLAAPAGSGDMASCLAREVAQEFSKVLRTALHRDFFLDGRQISAGRSWPDEKLLLDNSMKAVFEAGGRALVLDNVQNLTGMAAAMLHAYCDNGNAIYRNVLMVFVVHLDEGIPTTQGAVEDFFWKTWGKDITFMHVGALMVRIANNLVPLTPEPGFNSSQCLA